MKENSIEEDIILLKDFTECNFKRDKLENYKGSYKMGYFYYKDIQQAIEHILSDYKRVLKETEHKTEKIENQKSELAILNDKQKDFNKLQNTLKSYKGQFRRQEKENEKLKNKLLDTLEGKKVIEEETPQYIKENYIQKDKIEEILSETEITDFNSLVEAFLEIKKLLESE